MNRHRSRAAECRRFSKVLLILSIAAGLVAAAIYYSIGAGLPLLACITIAAVCGLGSLNEKVDADSAERRGQH